MPEITLEKYLLKETDGEIVGKGLVLKNYSSRHVLADILLKEKNNDTIMEMLGQTVSVDGNDMHVVEKMGTIDPNEILYRSSAILHGDGSLKVNGKDYENLEKYQSAIKGMINEDSEDKCLLSILEQYGEIFPVLCKLDELRKIYFS